MSSVDFAASQPHYLDHLAPIWHALPAKVRGDFFVPAALMGHAARLGVYGTPHRAVRARPLVVASHADAQQPRRRTKLDAKVQGPVVLLEHGAGQTYADRPDTPAHPGGIGRDNVGLFLDTNQWCHDRNVAAYPDTPSVVVGCAKLDPWWGTPPLPATGPPLVVVSFHWDAPVSIEGRSAFPHYRDAVAAAHRAGELTGEYRLAVHAHPRARRVVEAWCQAHAVPFIPEFSEVLGNAHAYLIDTSSTLYEFAATGRPVGALNIPEYRRDVEHGLRFWSHVPGPQLDDPGGLGAFITEVLADRDPWPRHRQAVLDEVYPVQGNSAQTAADAITDWLEATAPALVRPRGGGLRVAYVGNFGPEWSTENDCRLALECMGHEVVQLQENRTPPDVLRDEAMASDVLLWTTTWDDAQPHSETLRTIDVLLEHGVPTVAYHLDVFFGLDRGGRHWRQNPAFHLQWMFTADGDNVAEWADLRPRPWQHTRWLPAGVRHTVLDQPGVHRSEFACDVAFVGTDGLATAYHPEWTHRPQLISALRSMSKRNGWRFRNPGGSEPKVSRDLMADFYASAKVTVGDSLCLPRSASRYWSDRVYEATGRGGLLLMPQLDALEDPSQFGGELRMFPWGDFDALEGMVAGLLGDPEQRAALSAAGQAATRDRHTYVHRMGTLLEAVL